MRLRTNNGLQDTAAADILLITGPLSSSSRHLLEGKQGMEDTEGVGFQVHWGDENEKLMNDMPLLRDEDVFRLEAEEARCVSSQLSSHIRKQGQHIRVTIF